MTLFRKQQKKSQLKDIKNTGTLQTFPTVTSSPFPWKKSQGAMSWVLKLAMRHASSLNLPAKFVELSSIPYLQGGKIQCQKEKDFKFKHKC